MKFLDNQWGWDVNTSMPFLAFRALRRKAVEKHGELGILDISQGEPGYGFAPGTRSRRFFSFLLLVDTYLNNNQDQTHFGSGSQADIDGVLDSIERIARSSYQADIAEELLKDLDYFLTELERIAADQGQPKSKQEIIFDIFKFSILSGGRYPNSWGEMIVRMAVADERSEEFGFPVNFEDIVLLNGASQGVGMFFKGLGEEGIGYLQKGDAVLMISPVYAPYTQFIEDRQLDLVNISIDPETGELDEESFFAAQRHPKRIKAIIIIDPNNPTGFPFSEDILQKITSIAEQNNAIILSDEVYAEFFERKKSIIHFPEAKKRTVRLNALSKIERATGLRFGDFYMPTETRRFIAEEIIEPECPGFVEKYGDFRWFLFLCKSSGGSTIGVFQHISGVAGPSQILGLCHIILGKEERKEYVQNVRKKVEAFYAAMGLPPPKNSYYGTFDLRKHEGPLTAQKPIEQVLTELAEKGVIMMPANKFFSTADRAKDDRTRFVRASLPNLSVENSARAGRIIREHISQ